MEAPNIAMTHLRLVLKHSIFFLLTSEHSGVGVRKANVFIHLEATLAGSVILLKRRKEIFILCLKYCGSLPSRFVPLPGVIKSYICCFGRIRRYKYLQYQ